MLRSMTELHKNTRELFAIHFSDEGYFAIRQSSPSFVLHGDTIEECATKAQAAFDFLRERAV